MIVSDGTGLTLQNFLKYYNEKNHYSFLTSVLIKYNVQYKWLHE